MIRACIMAGLFACMAARGDVISGYWPAPVAAGGSSYWTDPATYRAYWQMQVADGTGTPDSVNGYAATSCPTYAAGPVLVSLGTNNGQHAQAFQFDGANDAFSFPSNAVISTNGTIGGWYAFKSLPGSGQMHAMVTLSADSGGQNQMQLRWEYLTATTTVLKVYSFLNNTPQIAITSSRVYTNFGDGMMTNYTQWINWTLTYPTNDVRLYLDGKLEGVDTSAGFISWGAAYCALIGANPFAAGRWANGRMSGVYYSLDAWSSNMVYDKVLHSNPTNFTEER